MTPQGVPSAARAIDDGVLVVDKPAGWTSHDVVGRVRRLAGTRKVGHAGTLDPLATGVLVVGLGRATRLLTYLVGADKEYAATIRLGQATVTDDADGEIRSAAGARDVDAEELATAVAALTGSIEQVPSAVSAIKVDGQRSYARVRSGQEVDLPPRPVTIHRFVVVAQRATTTEDGMPVTDLDVAVACSSGTYVRALARDLGAALGTGGHLTALRRTRVGPFTSADARTLDDLAADVRPLLLSEVGRRCFPVREVTPEEVAALRHGRGIGPSGRAGRPVAAMGPDGRLLALLLDRDPPAPRPSQAHPVLVLDPA